MTRRWQGPGTRLDEEGSRNMGLRGVAPAGNPSPPGGLHGLKLPRGRSLCQKSGCV